MSHLPSTQAEAALERLTDQFRHWRQSRPRRARIPSAWVGASCLAHLRLTCLAGGEMARARANGAEEAARQLAECDS